MIIKDKVYGQVEITEPIILDIINSPTFQRLKDIDQAGYFEQFFPNSKHTRFEHSVGAYLLLNKYNAPLEEQIAGLIHDVSHSAFSHCVDYVMTEASPEKQDHQDNILEKYIRSSEIAGIIQKYDFDLDYILNEHNFPLQETPSPNLCADRIDYILRDGVMYDKQDYAAKYLPHIKVQDNKWVFDNFDIALDFVKFFSRISSTYYAGIESAVMFKTVKDYLKYALEKNYISKEDLYTTDTEVLKKIETFHNEDEHLQLLFNRMNNKIPFTNDPNDFEEKIVCKSRAIDPLCFHEEKIMRVSDIEPAWGETRKKDSEPKEYFLKFQR